jgi:hypothetical protein
VQILEHKQERTDLLGGVEDLVDQLIRLFVGGEGVIRLRQDSSQLASRPPSQPEPAHRFQCGGARTMVMSSEAAAIARSTSDVFPMPVGAGNRSCGPIRYNGGVSGTHRFR